MLDTPISIDTVKSTLGSAYYDLGRLCGNYEGRINKWSMWKPMRIKGITSPSCKEVIMANMGINVAGATCGPLLNALLNTTSNTQPTPSGIIFGSYSYLAPTGGEDSPYRLTDFADVAHSDDSSFANAFTRGYNHSAEAPDSWTDVSLSKNELLELAQKTCSYSGSGTQWVLDTKGKPLGNVEMRYGTASYESIGVPSANKMPLTYLFGNALKGDYRLGLVVYMPYFYSGTQRDHWELFVSRGLFGFSNGVDISSLLVDLLTNGHAVYSMYYCYLKGVTSLTAVPVMVKNCKRRSTSTDVNSAACQAYVDSESLILTLPSATSITINIADTDSSGNEIVGTTHSGSDDYYRYLYYSPVNGYGGAYFRITKSVAKTTSTTSDVASEYLKIYIPNGCYATLAHGSNSTAGNVVATVVNDTGGKNCTVTKYNSLSDFQNDKNGSASSVTFAEALKNFWTYTGAKTPSSVTLGLSVSRKSL